MTKTNGYDLRMEVRVFNFFIMTPRMDVIEILPMLKEELMRLPKAEDLEVPIQGLLEKGLLEIENASIALSEDGSGLLKHCTDHWISDDQYTKLLTKKIRKLERCELAPYHVDADAYGAVIKIFEKEIDDEKRTYPPCPACAVSYVDISNFSMWSGAMILKLVSILKQADQPWMVIV